MCGIVGAVAERNVASVLVEGLKKLEYRGYDSAGIAITGINSQIQRLRTVGKVKQLEDALNQTPLAGTIGIAHTRWATHGKPTVSNAHPHMSGNDLAVVHNGIIENYESLRQGLLNDGYRLDSQTDTEVVAHLIHQQLTQGLSLLQAVQVVVKRLEGAYALAILSDQEPDKIIAVRSGCPLLIGLGIQENYIASDCLALAQFAEKISYLEDGDVAVVARAEYEIYDKNNNPVVRDVQLNTASQETTTRGEYRHFMQKEIFEQPSAIINTLEGRLGKNKVLDEIFGEAAPDILARIHNIHIVACGTSYHAALIASSWLEGIAGVSCRAEIASEFRYRTKVVPPGTLFICISQSGETADTLAALKQAKELEYESTLAICNVAQSSLVREATLTFMTRAGTEIGVASTKAFTTQLVGLLLLTAVLGRRNGMTADIENDILQQLTSLPKLIKDVLTLDEDIRKLAEFFADKEHTLFLGRGEEYPVAMEGALKLKELSYIHAEAYPAGELKHGPLALVDKDMPVIAVAPNDQLLEKLKSNLQEVRARAGQLFIFADKRASLTEEEGIKVLLMPSCPRYITPIIYTIPLQLLAYHVAVIKGTDVDQPRNLAKSVTVE